MALLDLKTCELTRQDIYLPHAQHIMVKQEQHNLKDAPIKKERNRRPDAITDGKEF